MRTNRCLAAILVSFAFTATACVVGDEEEADLDDIEASAGTPWITATDTVYGGTTNISFYAGRYQESALMIQVACYQNDQLILGSGSLELHYEYESLGHDIWKGDHWEVQRGPMGPTQTWLALGGEADYCEAFASTYRRGVGRTIAKVDFQVEGGP